MWSLHEYVFPLIVVVIKAKKAREILQTRFERTPYVKLSKMQLDNSQFEAMRMQEDETINKFHTRITLGEPLSESKLLKKILRSLLKRFQMKVTTIQLRDCWMGRYDSSSTHGKSLYI